MIFFKAISFINNQETMSLTYVQCSVEVMDKYSKYHKKFKQFMIAKYHELRPDQPVDFEKLLEGWTQRHSGFVFGIFNKRIVSCFHYVNNADHIMIYNVYCLPNYRRRGFAFSLLHQFRTKKPQMLEVAFDNIAARRLYEKVGFVECDRSVSYLRMTKTN